MLLSAEFMSWVSAKEHRINRKGQAPHNYKTTFHHSRADMFFVAKKRALDLVKKPASASSAKTPPNRANQAMRTIERQNAQIKLKAFASFV